MTHLCSEKVRTFVFKLNVAVRSFLVLPSASHRTGHRKLFRCRISNGSTQTWFRTAAIIHRNATCRTFVTFVRKRSSHLRGGVDTTAEKCVNLAQTSSVVR